MLDHRNHDRFVLFETNTSNVITLPRPMMAAAACEVIFGRIWVTLESSKASKVVSNCIEKAVERACQGKAPHVLAKRQYVADGKVLELDVATRTDDKIMLFEMKAKSLTASARSGDMFAFIDDYTKSYLALLKQLTRHEYNLRKGITPGTLSRRSRTSRFQRGIFGQKWHLPTVKVSPLGDGALLRSK
jgi:hypothetical protein